MSTRYSEPLDIVNILPETEVVFSLCSVYRYSESLDIVNKRLLQMMFTISRVDCIIFGSSAIVTVHTHFCQRRRPHQLLIAFGEENLPCLLSLFLAGCESCPETDLKKQKKKVGKTFASLLSRCFKYCIYIYIGECLSVCL